MRATPLFLSHWDAPIPISIPVNVVEDLENYHVMSVRFLYDCFRKKQNGAVLNHDNGMNFPIQISAFFNALHTSITPQSPVLILCSEESLGVWNYHLTNHGGYVATLLSPDNCTEIQDGEVHRAILATVDSTVLLRKIKDLDFFAVVVEDLDNVVTKMIVKQLKGLFNIGLTTRNFLKDPDQKLLWSMLKWSNTETVGKLDEFCEEDTDHLKNVRNPYRAWWHRLTWSFCESFKKPSENEIKQYKKEIQQWCNTNRGSYKQEPKRQTRRGKSVKPEIKEEPLDVPEEITNKRTRKRQLVGQLIKVEPIDKKNARKRGKPVVEKPIIRDIKEEPSDYQEEEIPTNSNESNIVKVSRKTKNNTNLAESNHSLRDLDETSISLNDPNIQKDSSRAKRCKLNLTESDHNCSQSSGTSDVTIIYDLPNSPSTDIDEDPAPALNEAEAATEKSKESLTQSAPINEALSRGSDSNSNKTDILSCLYGDDD